MQHNGSHLTTEARAALDAGDVEALLALSHARYAGWTMEADPAPADPAPADPAPADPAPADPEPADPADPKDPDKAEDARVTRANKEAAKYRTELRTTQDALAKQGETLAALAKVLNPDSTETDPAAQLAEVTGKAETLQTENVVLKAELLVHNLSEEHGAKPSALLDSRDFITKLTGLDPAAEDYSTKVAEAIKEAVSKNAAYRAGQGSAAGGSELTAEQREAAKNKRPTSLAGAIGTAYQG